MHDDLENIKGAKERVDHKRIVELADILILAVIAVAVFFVIGGL